VFVECGFVEGRGMRDKKRLLATAAGRVAAELVGAYAVGGVAVGADDVKRVGHKEVF
jgi:hypothetical protein